MENQNIPNTATIARPAFNFSYDPILLIAIIMLLCWGMVMVASASIAMAERELGQPFYYLQRQALFALLGVIAAIGITRMPLAWWQESARASLLAALLLLCLVLIPGIGQSVNGARRWLSLGFFGFQVSELVKLIMIIYTASYIVRYAEQVRTQFIGFLKPMAVIALVAALLLLEPDFGAVVVIACITLGMLFLAGVKLRHFTLLITLAIGALAMLILIAPYRMRRLTSFIDPWADQFNSGYQLTQALIAFGRGEWFGAGLGQSVQKLFYLPEAHTDFIFAVLGEELGLIGALLFLAVYLLMLWRTFLTAQAAQKQQQWFGAYVAYGITIWFAVQALISIGVNMGILPTKGLTLPFVSYGGSSLLVTLMAVGFLLRVNMETNSILSTKRVRSLCSH
jgi:cell division protein FtsW